jgi:hypothetical protein
MGGAKETVAQSRCDGRGQRGMDGLGRDSAGWEA